MELAARIVLTTFGSLGDLHPHMALALGLQARGHEVTIATGEPYREKIEAAGLGFRPLRPDFSTYDPALLEQVMDPRKGTEYVLRLMVFPYLRETYKDLIRAVQGADLLVSGSLAYTAPLVAETSGIRWVSSVLSPIVFVSAYDPPVLPPVPVLAGLRALGPGVNRGVMGLGRVATYAWHAPYRHLRRELGLPPGKNILYEGQHSPKLVLALFSPLFARPQPDWPQSTLATGFLFYDRNGGDESERLKSFLEAGPPPVVFTLGSSAVMAAGGFYRESLEAAKRLGCRAVLLTGPKGRNRLPEPLPETIAAFDYLPYSALFPLAAATVHLGGIGTTAQALRAGRPMIVVPFSHDQPDNAARVERLGVGHGLPKRHYTAERLAHVLRQVLDEPDLAAAASRLGQRLREEDGVGAACDAIEGQL